VAVLSLRRRRRIDGRLEVGSPTIGFATTEEELLDIAREDLPEAPSARGGTGMMDVNTGQLELRAARRVPASSRFDTDDLGPDQTSWG